MTDAALAPTPFEAALPAVGLTVRGLRGGLAGAPRLLLLHGWPEWSRAWRPVMQRLASRHELLAPDFRGFGDTLPAVLEPSDDAGPERHVDDLLALLDHLGWQRFGVVSHDVGSFVAQALARRAPERVEHLYFFNCVHAGIGPRWVAPRHVPELWYQAFQQLPWAAAMVGSSPAACRLYLEHILRHWSHQQAWVDAELDTWVAHFLQPGRLQGGFNWYRSVYPARLAVMEGRAPALPPIEIPTRVCWGAHDPVLKAAWIDTLPATFRSLSVDLMPDAGHFVHLERPDAAAADIARAVAAHPGGADPR